MIADVLSQWWVTFGDLFWFGIWCAGALVGMAGVALAWDRVLIPLTKRTRTELDGMVVEAVRRPVQWLLLAAVLSVGSRSTLARVPGVAAHPAWGVYEGALYVATVLAGTWLAYAAVRAVGAWWAGRTATAALGQLAGFFRRLGKLLFLFIALTIILGHFNVQITGLLATAGVASLAVALAAQETLGNWIAGVALMLDRPFRPGDRIELADGQAGDVIDIGMRSTRVMSFDNTVITIPNAEIAKTRVVNHNAPDPKVKIRCTLGVAYGTDLRKVKAVLLGIMQAHGEVLKDPPPAVYFTEFAESSLNLLFVCFVADYREKFRILDELNMAIKDRFEAEGVEIPFPQRSVHVRLDPAVREIVSDGRAGRP